MISTAPLTVLSEPPENLGYQPTCKLAWVIRPALWIEDEQTLLAQLWKSNFRGVEDIWVAVPSFVVAPADRRANT